MRIINFNHQKSAQNTWKGSWRAWNKTYCQDLHNQITSLYDYIQWNCPEYLILNSPTKLSEESDFTPFESLSDITKEPRLQTIYEKEIEVSQGGLKMEKRSVFFPSKLNYHQGFYNQSFHGDGMLCFPYTFHTMEEETVEYLISCSRYPLYDNCRVIRWQENLEETVLPSETCTLEEWNNMFLCSFSMLGGGVQLIANKESILNIHQTSEYVTFSLKSWNTVSHGTGYLIVFYDTEKKYENGYYSFVYKDKKWHKILFPNQSFFITTSDQSFSFYSLDMTDEEDIAIPVPPDSFEFITESGEISYFACSLDYNTLCAIQSLNSSDYTYNFPSGYLCLLNKQPTGKIYDKNPLKTDLNNYLVAPIGNGGYYDIYWNNKNLEASYYANELGNFTNQISINLAQNCRYINPNHDYYYFNQKNLSINIGNWLITKDETKPQLIDAYGNIWTGEPDLVGRPYFNGEHVFADVTYTLYMTAEENKKVYYFSALAQKPIILQPELWMY